MNYTKTTFVNKSQPPINATWLNELGSIIEELCKYVTPGNGTEGSGSTGATYIVNVEGVTAAPTDTELPYALQFIPTADNEAGCSITIWGGTYPVYDMTTGKAIAAGEIKSGVPANLLFDGNKFWCRGGGRYLKYTTVKGTGGEWDTEFPIELPDTLSPALSNPIAYNGDMYATRVFQGVWNDYAEYRMVDAPVEAGRVVVEIGNDIVRQSTGRLEAGAMIVSDTFGSVMGSWGKNVAPVCVSGRVLAYPSDPIYSYNLGDPVCSGYNGTVSKMSREEVREYPERIIGTVSSIPNYETWGETNIPVNGRIWIKVR